MRSETQTFPTARCLLLLWISEIPASYCQDFLLFCFSFFFFFSCSSCFSCYIKKRKKGKEQSTVSGFTWLWSVSIRFLGGLWRHYPSNSLAKWSSWKRLYKKWQGHKILSKCTNSTVGRDALWLAQRVFLRTFCRDFWCANIFNAMGARWILGRSGISLETATRQKLTHPETVKADTVSLTRIFTTRREPDHVPGTILQPRIVVLVSTGTTRNGDNEPNYWSGEMFSAMSAAAY